MVVVTTTTMVMMMVMVMMMMVVVMTMIMLIMVRLRANDPTGRPSVSHQFRMILHQRIGSDVSRLRFSLITGKTGGAWRWGGDVWGGGGGGGGE